MNDLRLALGASKLVTQAGVATVNCLNPTLPIGVHDTSLSVVGNSTDDGRKRICSLAPAPVPH